MGGGASKFCSGFRIKVVENREELGYYVIPSGLLSYFFVSVLRPASVWCTDVYGVWGLASMAGDLVSNAQTVASRKNKHPHKLSFYKARC